MPNLLGPVPRPMAFVPLVMSVKSELCWYTHGLRKPSCFWPFWSRASSRSDTRPAKVGAEADVPPTLCVMPETTTWKPSPRAATSGVPRPLALKSPLGGNFGALFAAVWYPLTSLSCHVAFERSKSQEKPPPEPNWSEAISSPAAPSTKRVAPTAVTHGDEAGHDG